MAWFDKWFTDSWFSVTSGLGVTAAVEALPATVALMPAMVRAAQVIRVPIMDSHSLGVSLPAPVITVDDERGWFEEWFDRGWFNAAKPSGVMVAPGVLTGRLNLPALLVMSGCQMAMPVLKMTAGMQPPAVEQGLAVNLELLNLMVVGLEPALRAEATIIPRTLAATMGIGEPQICFGAYVGTETLKGFWSLPQKGRSVVIEI